MFIEDLLIFSIKKIEIFIVKKLEFRKNFNLFQKLFKCFLKDFFNCFFDKFLFARFSHDSILFINCKLSLEKIFKAEINRKKIK